MKYYSRLLMWAVTEKMRKGWSPESVERQYGIPRELAACWLRASRPEKDRRIGHGR